jgi:hypothetical protein
MLRNAHETWLRYCDLHRPLLHGSGIPVLIYQSERLFRELLYSGTTATRTAEAALQAMSIEQWASFERFVVHFFNDFESYGSLELFPAYRSEKQRRG